MIYFLFFFKLVRIATFEGFFYLSWAMNVTSKMGLVAYLKRNVREEISRTKNFLLLKRDSGLVL